MAYDWEADELRSARYQETELERAGTPRIVGGVYRTGEPTDDR